MAGPATLYTGHAWHILWPRRRRAKLVLDAENRGGQVLFVLGCNTRFTGKAMHVAPHADLADGKLDMVFVRRASRAQMLRLFRAIMTAPSLRCRTSSTGKCARSASKPSPRRAEPGWGIEILCVG